MHRLAQYVYSLIYTRQYIDKYATDGLDRTRIEVSANLYISENLYARYAIARTLGSREG